MTRDFLLKRRAELEAASREATLMLQGMTERHFMLRGALAEVMELLALPDPPVSSEVP